MKQLLIQGFFIAAALAVPVQAASAQSDTLKGAATETQAEMPVADGYANLFPAEISGVRFEMPKQEFLDLLDAKGLSYRANSENTIFLVEFSGAEFSAMMFRFDSYAGEILTETEIRFADEAKAKAYAATHFPPEQAYFASYGDVPNFYASAASETYRVKAWQFETKIFFVAVMPNTRWSNQ